jgi:hypothetical protein
MTGLQARLGEVQVQVLKCQETAPNVSTIKHQ